MDLNHSPVKFVTSHSLPKVILRYTSGNILEKSRIVVRFVDKGLLEWMIARNIRKNTMTIKHYISFSARSNLRDEITISQYFFKLNF